MSTMINSLMIYDYITQYHHLIYNFYSKEYPAYACTYYRLDYTNSIKEDVEFRAGSYELIGDLSGWKWHKIYMMPILFAEPIENVANTYDERGKITELTTSFVVPDTIGMQPLINDLVLFPTSLRKEQFSKYPSFVVTGYEKATFSNETMWKIYVKSFWAHEDDIDKQVNDYYIFVDFFKQIYPLQTGQELVQRMQSCESLMRTFFDQYIDQQCGLIRVSD